MIYEFLQYTYSWHSNSAITAGVLGGIIGVIFSLKRKKKFATIALYVILALFIIYPIFASRGYLNYQKGADICEKHKDEYVMIRGVCYKPVNGYVPLTTWDIAKDVGDAVIESRKVK